MIGSWLDNRRIGRALEELARAHTSAGTFSGTVRVSRGGKTLHRAAYGMADRERGIPNTPETTFRIGSVAKTLTALAVLRLVDQGRLTVDDPLSRHLPGYPAGDALHLALASYHRCDFLVTWNCKHLANANKFGHIRRVNGLLGLFTPALITPLELLGDSDDEE